MSAYPMIPVGHPRRCGHPREAGAINCRECDKLAARKRAAERRERVRAKANVPMRNGRPLVSDRVAALIEECRPAYVAAITGSPYRRGAA